ncbi:DUF58 domain-containing protein [Lentibacillus sp. Marseille-P4043]|uniref:DUF58 domain-containing protein n=1 Tax=Lentibacillus sp. Marseille-P4043 TaxID=2040293 RepID=UPI000D0B4191|nr:DUF58 domain-containing protein [Lentibacillus sp. Marseille-P4043]
MNSMMRFIGKLLFNVLLLLLLYAFAMFQGGFVSWFLFFGYLPIFLYHIGLLFYPLQKWQVTRTVSHHIVRSGDTVTVKVRMERSIPYPLYYCVCEEIFPESLKKVDNRMEKYHHLDQPEQLDYNRIIKKVLFPGFRRVIEWNYRIEQVPRGEHQFRAIRIKTGDLFGFINKEHVFKAENQFIAYPNERPVRMAERISSFEQGAIASNTLNLKNTNVATGIREYLPGDKFSWIDWKQTAKKNTMMTKEFEQEKSTDTLLVLDSCSYDGINILAYEAAIEIGLSLMEAIKQQSQAEFVTIGREAKHFPFHQDPTQKELLMRHLTKVQPDGIHPFAVKLKEESMKMANGVVMMVMTTHLDDALKETLQQIRQRSKSVIVIYVQAAARITKHEHRLIQQLQFKGVVVNVVTEEQLVQRTVEVSVL